jgi:hypothetical protein
LIGTLLATPVRVTVSQPTSTTQLLTELVPVLITFLVAAAAFLRSWSNRNDALTAKDVATRTATRVEGVEGQVNGSLTQALQRISALEGAAGVPTPPLPPHVEKPHIVDLH